jgi:hypothetical protein
MLGLSAARIARIRSNTSVSGLPALARRRMRFLISSPRKREQQEAAIRVWLEQRFQSVPLQEAA